MFQYMRNLVILYCKPSTSISIAHLHRCTCFHMKWKSQSILYKPHASLLISCKLSASQKSKITDIILTGFDIFLNRYPTKLKWKLNQQTSTLNTNHIIMSLLENFKQPTACTVDSYHPCISASFSPNSIC